MNVARLIELVNEYGVAKFGDQWWPGNAGPRIGLEKGAELAALLEGGANAATGPTGEPDQPTS